MKKDSLFDDISSIDDTLNQEDTTYFRGANNLFIKTLKDSRSNKNKTKDKEDLFDRHLENCGQILACPFCNSQNVIKDGKDANGRQRYKCKDCKKCFVSLSASAIRRSKISIMELIELIKLIINGDTTISTINLMLGLSAKTINFYRKKLLFLAIDWLENQKLSGTVYADEMYFKAGKKGSVLQYEDIYNTKRGLSDQQLCVVLAFDTHGNYIVSSTKTGKVSKAAIIEAFRNHLGHVTKLITDKDKSYVYFAKQNSINIEQYESKSKEKKAVKNLTKINNFCSYIRRKVNKHSGIKSSNLTGYIALFLMMKTFKKKYKSKAYRVIAHQLLVSRRWLKFRDSYGK